MLKSLPPSPVLWGEHHDQFISHQGPCTCTCHTDQVLAAVMVPSKRPTSKLRRSRHEGVSSKSHCQVQIANQSQVFGRVRVSGVPCNQVRPLLDIWNSYHTIIPYKHETNLAWVRVPCCQELQSLECHLLRMSQATRSL